MSSSNTDLPPSYASLSQEEQQHVQFALSRAECIAVAKTVADASSSSSCLAISTSRTLADCRYRQPVFTESSKIAQLRKAFAIKYLESQAACRASCLAAGCGSGRPCTIGCSTFNNVRDSIVMRMPILIAKLDVPQIICNIVNARMSPLTSDQVYAAHAAACAFLPTDVACHIPHSPEIMNVQVWSMQFVIPVKPPLLTPPIQQQQQQTNKRKRAVLEHLPAPVPPRMREQQTPEEEWMNTVLR